MLKRIALYRISSVKESLKILGIKSPTTKANIKKQYIKLAKQFHPDAADESKKNSKEDEQFVQINKAYQMLRDLS